MRLSGSALWWVPALVVPALVEAALVEAVLGRFGGVHRSGPALVTGRFGGSPLWWECVSVGTLKRPRLGGVSAPW